MGRESQMAMFVNEGRVADMFGLAFSAICMVQQKGLTLLRADAIKQPNLTDRRTRRNVTKQSFA